MMHIKRISRIIMKEEERTDNLMQNDLGSKILATKQSWLNVHIHVEVISDRINIPGTLCLDEEFFDHVHVSRPNISVQTSPKSRGRNQICHFF